MLIPTLVAVTAQAQDLTFTADQLVAGVSADLTVTGASPGASIAVLYSTAGQGVGPCPPILSGGCLDILAPVKVLATGTADGSGTAVLTRTPPLVASSRAVWMQAAEWTPASRTSNVLSQVVGRGQAALRFFGNGGLYGDRVRVPVDDPSNNLPGPPVDVGATDFTIEMWLKMSPGANGNPAVSCGWGSFDWVSSNIFLDRDRHSQSPSWGAGLAAERLVFAVNGPYNVHTLCGPTPIADDQWHHVAVQRRRSDGLMEIWLDGQLEASVVGPGGDVSYPDDGVPQNVCPAGSCDYSDPYLVFGAEKHGYPGISYSGAMDEVRVSTVRRYAAPFAPPSAPFVTDPDTVGLYHLDEGWGPVIDDEAQHPDGPTDGEVRLGGNPEGPVWALDSPFTP